MILCPQLEKKINEKGFIESRVFSEVLRWIFLFFFQNKVEFLRLRGEKGCIICIYMKGVLCGTICIHICVLKQSDGMEGKDIYHWCRAREDIPFFSHIRAQIYKRNVRQVAERHNKKKKKRTEYSIHKLRKDFTPPKSRIYICVYTPRFIKLC